MEIKRTYDLFQGEGEELLLELIEGVDQDLGKLAWEFLDKGEVDQLWEVNDWEILCERISQKAPYFHISFQSNSRGGKGNDFVFIKKDDFYQTGQIVKEDRVNDLDNGFINFVLEVIKSMEKTNFEKEIRRESQQIANRMKNLFN